MFEIIFNYETGKEIIDTAETITEAEHLAREYAAAFRAKIEIKKK